MRREAARGEARRRRHRRRGGEGVLGRRERWRQRGGSGLSWEERGVARRCRRRPHADPWASAHRG
jgi:hypothetical protein